LRGSRRRTQPHKNDGVVGVHGREARIVSRHPNACIVMMHGGSVAVLRVGVRRRVYMKIS
jgi:hypothetical protein